MPSVGQNVPRLDGVDKVTGLAQYVDDIVLPNMWYGAVVRTTIPHGRITKVELDPSFEACKQLARRVREESRRQVQVRSVKGSSLADVIDMILKA